MFVGGYRYDDIILLTVQQNKYILNRYNIEFVRKTGEIRLVINVPEHYYTRRLKRINDIREVYIPIKDIRSAKALILELTKIKRA